MKIVFVFIFILVVIGALAGNGFGASAATRVIDDSDTVVLPGNVYPLARPEFDIGAAASSLPMERMILVLKRSAEKQAELDRFLADLHNPASPVYQQWLTSEQFGERFGPLSEDIDAVTRWLTSQGFVIDEIAKGRSWINFSGIAAHVERAFHTAIHEYEVNGRLHHANDRDPSIPRALADVVSGIVSLNDFPRRAMHSVISPVAEPDYTSGSTHYFSPGDFATIYNLNPLYNAGIESGSVSGGSGLWSTGGGVSSVYGKPAWQVSPGVPADGKRDVPDVSLSAAVHDAYLVVSQSGGLYAAGGTSASRPPSPGSWHSSCRRQASARATPTPASTRSATRSMVRAAWPCSMIRSLATIASPASPATLREQATTLPQASARWMLTHSLTIGPRTSRFRLRPRVFPCPRAAWERPPSARPLLGISVMPFHSLLQVFLPE